MICDLHTHSLYSFDGKDSLDQFCASAQKRGVQIFATTDHCDMTSGPEGIRNYLSGEEDRLRDIQRLQAASAGPELLCGVELGNPMDQPGLTADFLSTRSFDFVLGALHFLSDGSDIYQMRFPDQASVDRMFTDYFQSVLRLVEFGGFDSLAHLDYPVRVLRQQLPHTSVLAWRDRIDPILQLLVRKDIALEVNTRGCYDWQHRPGPEAWVLLRYRQLGGRLVTIGSDAHTHTLVGEGYADAAEALRRAGFDSCTIYRHRKPCFLPL